MKMVSFDIYLLGKMFMLISMKLVWMESEKNVWQFEKKKVPISVWVWRVCENTHKANQLDKLNMFTEVTCCATHFSKTKPRRAEEDLQAFSQLLRHNVLVTGHPHNCTTAQLQHSRSKRRSAHRSVKVAAIRLLPIGA